MNLINPPAYVQYINSETVQHQIIASDTNPKTYALTRAPNRMTKTGRINCEGIYQEGVIAISVSPLNPKFQSQIENGVWPYVKCMLDKNYFSISSCEGHNDGTGDHFYITIACPYLDEIEIIENKIKNIFGCKYTRFNSIAKYEIVWNSASSNVEAIRLREVNEEDYKKEADDINNMFLRNHSRYYFLKIDMFQNKDSIFFNLTPKAVLERIQYYLYKKKSMKKLLTVLKELPNSLA
jgi:hypothetical protein